MLLSIGHKRVVEEVLMLQQLMYLAQVGMGCELWDGRRELKLVIP